jgi:hypothetical protein
VRQQALKKRETKKAMNEKNYRCQYTASPHRCVIVTEQSLRCCIEAADFFFICICASASAKNPAFSRNGTMDTMEMGETRRTQKENSMGTKS